MINNNASSVNLVSLNRLFTFYFSLSNAVPCVEISEQVTLRITLDLVMGTFAERAKSLYSRPSRFF